MCPFAHRVSCFDIGGKLRLNISQVEIALAEANASFSCFEIEDLRNKPQWYIEKVNPASQVHTHAAAGPQF
jgi:hypothetical protein